MHNNKVFFLIIFYFYYLFDIPIEIFTAHKLFSSFILFIFGLFRGKNKMDSKKKKIQALIKGLNKFY
jgi:hypothetical protein